MPTKRSPVKRPIAVRLTVTAKKTPSAAKFDVLLSPQLQRSTRWSRAVQKALVGSMQKWFVTVDRRRLERALDGLLAVARLHYTNSAFRRSSRVQRAQRMLDEVRST